MLNSFKTKAITFLCCVYCFTVNGKSLDSLLAARISDSSKVRLLVGYSFQLVNRNPDSSILVARYALKIAARSEDKKKDAADCLNSIGWAYHRLGKEDSAKWYLSEARTIFHAQGDDFDEVTVTTNLAIIGEAEGDYAGALKQLLGVLAIFERAKLTDSAEKKGYAVAEKMIGIIYRKQENYPNAKLYLKKAVADFQRLNEQNYYADAISSLGILYHDLGDLDTAIFFYRKGLNTYRQLENLSGGALSCENLGEAFFLKSGEHTGPFLDSSLRYYLLAYKLFSYLNSSTDILIEKSAIGSIFLIKKQYGPAEKYIQEALAGFEELHDIKNSLDALVSLSQLYHDTHDFHKAYDFLLKANAFSDSLNKQSNNQAIADMLAKYETDKKDRSIALLNTENKLLITQKILAEHNLNKTRIIEFFSLTLIILIAALMLILYNRNRIKQKLNEVQMRNRISNDLHDDVGSSLSSILLLSNLAAKANIHQPELLGKIGENASEAIERIGDLIWTTNPKYDDGENLRSKIINYLVLLHQVPGISVNVNISEAIKNIKFPMEIRKNIFLIIKEAINNILKHARATEVTINLFVKGKDLVLEISDNGKGFNNHNTQNGNGLETMQLRAEALKGKLLFDTAPGHGTKITGIIPVPGMR